MCGIFGYTGIREAKEILLNGLMSLEYRGYDSAGLAIWNEDPRPRVRKCCGRVAALRAVADADDSFSGKCGIGHTRWATHGAPSEKNAHPHVSRKITLVHNGIIDNDMTLRQKLENRYKFVSETDTECVAHWLDLCYERTGDPAAALREAALEMRGSYALAVLFHDHPGEIWCIRKDNPLILAVCEHGALVSSDIPALLSHTREIVRPEEGEIFCVCPQGLYAVTRDGRRVKRETERFEEDIEEADKAPFDTFMLKEIHEEPGAIRRAVARRINAQGLPDFSVDGIDDKVLEDWDSVAIVSCGSATHAGLVGRSMIEHWAGIPVTVNTASEYRYEPPASYGRSLVIPISQSGETADTLAALRLAKSRGHQTLAIVNAVGSAVAREADHVMYQGAGPEIAVATTKGYTTQVTVLALIALKLALVRGTLSEEEVKRRAESLRTVLPCAVEEILKRQEEIRRISSLIQPHKDVYYIGRGPDDKAGYECSLKLKEISYIHCESYAAGELKHGTLSLIEKGTPVIALASDPKYFDKMCGNIREVRARGGCVILVCDHNFPTPQRYGDACFLLPEGGEDFSPILTVVFSQLLAYETAKALGCDVDHPRNLAKSVTVE